VSKELNWLLGQALWGMQTAIINVESERAEKVLHVLSAGQEIVEVEGRRWAIWYDAAGERNATPLAEEGQ
jgi:hypothetical protein